MSERRYRLRLNRLPPGLRHDNIGKAGDPILKAIPQGIRLFRPLVIIRRKNQGGKPEAEQQNRDKQEADLRLNGVFGGCTLPLLCGPRSEGNPFAGKQSPPAVKTISTKGILGVIVKKNGANKKGDVRRNTSRKLHFLITDQLTAHEIKKRTKIKKAVIYSSCVSGAAETR